ncbi:CoA-binding protein [Candidatus Woesearchaeota archaeon]|nr:CoA-binding protein [Candidatus Woesearchaeota archaeon]
MNLDNFFYAKSIAVIGVSKEPTKIGHVIFKNFIDADYNGELYPVNPGADFILNHRCYKSVLDIKDNVDLGIVAVPAKFVLKVVEQCGKRRIKDLIIITAGFEEIGNHKLKKDLDKLLKRYKIRVIGPNCLGTYNGDNNFDSLFLPRSRLKRPEKGSISFVSQSGALGSAILDLAAKEGYGIAKFISYGNAININEADIIEYLGEDEQTKVICLYIEGAKDGKRFLEVCRKVSKKKPIVAVKGGITKAGSKAAMSHTGSLAGSAEIYNGVFKQAGIIRADTLEDLFNYARVLDNCIKPKGNRVQIITNGGGYGIVSADALSRYNLRAAQLSGSSVVELKKRFPELVIVKNPMDLIGDADTERYKDAIEACMKDKNIDIIYLVILYQTPLITPDIIDIVSEYKDLGKKPIIVVSTGSEFTEVLRKGLEEAGVPCFEFPDNAMKAIGKLVEYYS